MDCLTPPCPPAGRYTQLVPGLDPATVTPVEGAVCPCGTVWPVGTALHPCPGCEEPMCAACPAPGVQGLCGVCSRTPALVVWWQARPGGEYICECGQPNGGDLYCAACFTHLAAT